MAQQRAAPDAPAGRRAWGRGGAAGGGVGFADLSWASIAASGAFGAICGSSVATAASMTRIALPEMQRAGYDEGYAASSVAAVPS